MIKKSNLKPWTTKSTQILHSTPWMEVKADTCVADGKELVYTYTRRVDEGPLIIAEDVDKKLWLVRQYRHPIKKIIWQFPGEGKHPGESWEDAARRGVREELGRTAAELHDLGEFFVDPGGLEQKYHAFLATGLEVLSQADQLHKQTEHPEVENLEIARFSLEEIDALIAAGEICDNWTLSALYLYARAPRQGGARNPQTNSNARLV